METRAETSNRTSTQTGNASTRVNDTATNLINTAKDTLNTGVEKVTKSTTDVYDSAIKYSKQNPGTALAIALAGGVTLGFILGRSSKSRFDDTLWGAVATAAIKSALDYWT
ncbi:MAG TPA: hypothetical protein VFC63_15500 [Blastocatellia bacterium]|nr:hypothetical protein [Blastocatellia bacterium]